MMNVDHEEEGHRQTEFDQKQASRRQQQHSAAQLQTKKYEQTYDSQRHDGVCEAANEAHPGPQIIRSQAGRSTVTR
jgi:hypothetical protein